MQKQIHTLTKNKKYLMPLLKILMYGNWKNSSWKNDFGTYFNGVGIEFICDKENLDTFIEEIKHMNR